MILARSFSRPAPEHQATAVERVAPSLIAGVVVLLILGAPPAAAATLDMTTIMQKMKAALEPERPSTREILMVVRSQGQTVEWRAKQARKKLPDGKRVLTVLLEPDAVTGTALLDWERKGQHEMQWVYLPALRRVRRIVPVSAYEAFLNTDFTYYDLGFFPIDERGFTLLGEETHAGRAAYKVEEVPTNPWYYSRIMMWIAKDSFLPLERDYYDPGNQLWKVEQFEDITVIDGVPTPLRIVMEDRLGGGSSEQRVSHVRYDVKVPDDLFSPDNLPRASTRSFWNLPLE
jgi:outer membrane lipoprotein-sorting protein